MIHIKKYNESNTNIEVFILLHWFWEGDDNLINEYKDCFLSLEEAKESATNIKFNKSTVKLYLFDEKTPSDGHYGQPGFAQIISKKF